LGSRIFEIFFNDLQQFFIGVELTFDLRSTYRSEKAKTNPANLICC
jgi:hypothetical protein